MIESWIRRPMFQTFLCGPLHFLIWSCFVASVPPHWVCLPPCCKAIEYHAFIAVAMTSTLAAVWLRNSKCHARRCVRCALSEGKRFGSHDDVLFATLLLDWTKRSAGGPGSPKARSSTVEWEVEGRSKENKILSMIILYSSCKKRIVDWSESYNDENQSDSMSIS